MPICPNCGKFNHNAVVQTEDRREGDDVFYDFCSNCTHFWNRRRLVPEAALSEQKGLKNEDPVWLDRHRTTLVRFLTLLDLTDEKNQRTIEKILNLMDEHIFTEKPRSRWVTREDHDDKLPQFGG